MEPLSTFPLPLPPNQPPSGYEWDDRTLSALSTTTAFNTKIDKRDQFLGKPRCIVCGIRITHNLEHCHIIAQSEPEVWDDLKERNYLPPQAKNDPRHEPRDGLLMCNHHHHNFDSYLFFIRYMPKTGKFVFINFSETPDLQEFDGMAVALDIKEKYVPFPSLFIIHEMRVRGFHPFAPPSPSVAQDAPWQKWITSDGVFNQATNSFTRYQVEEAHGSNVSTQPQLQPTAAPEGEAAGDRTLVELNDNVIGEILAATWASPSWKACQVEGTSWEGTAEENIQKYKSTIGTEES